jgi:hypothetical protein
VLVGVPQLRDPLARGRGASAQLGELLADLPRVAAQLLRELTGLQPLAGADLAGPVVAFHRGGQPLGVGGVAGDRGVLVAAGGKVRLQPGKLLGGGAAVADGLDEDATVSPLLVA